MPKYGDFSASAKEIYTEVEYLTELVHNEKGILKTPIGKVRLPNGKTKRVSLFNRKKN